MKNGFLNMARVFRQEWSIMLHDAGLLVFFLLLPLGYPIVYTLIYNPEVVRKINVAVVDDCRTARSRHLVRQTAAAPSINIYGYASNMSEAKEMWAEHDVYAVLHIPSDFDQKINTGEQAHATMYCDMSLLLRYRALLSSLTDLQIQLAQDITSDKVSMLGMEGSDIGSLPVESRSHFLGDSQQGFASFIIPGIIILILQQSMLLGIGILGGTANERRRANGGIDPLAVKAGPVATAFGKALAYTTAYLPMTIYVLHWVPWMFNLPQNGSPLDYLPFIFPMLLGSAFLGQALVVFMKEREYVFLVVVFTSVIFLFLSGLTWPRYAMSELWYNMGNLIPATWGVEGFIRINGNGGTLVENSHPYLMMWALTALYCVLAVIVEWHYLRKANVKREVVPKSV